MPCNTLFSRSLSFYDAATTEIYTLSLHDALPISRRAPTLALARQGVQDVDCPAHDVLRSEEHTSELQSRFELVCRLLLEKKNAAGASRWSSSPLAPAANRDRVSGDTSPDSRG